MLLFPFRFRFVFRWKRKRNGKLSFPKIEKRNGNETETAASLIPITQLLQINEHPLSEKNYFRSDEVLMVTLIYSALFFVCTTNNSCPC
jgi:hypothetical protein